MPSNLIVDGALLLHGPIGLDWYGEGITAGAVVQALAEIGRGNPVTVRLNSGGGIATEGEAIRAALAAHDGEVSVKVEGIAASAASIAAMGATKGRLSMSRGAVMMIHDPAAFTIGTAADHQKSIAALDAIGNAMASSYAARTGRTAKAERQRMTDETWMTAEEAVAEGYADAVDGADPAPAEPTAFNYGLYARAPERLVAAARDHGWTRFGGFQNPQPRGAVAAHTAAPEEPMTTTTTAPAAAAATAAAADPAASATAAAAAATAATEAQARAEAAAASRANEINGLCKLAGFAAKAGDFIASGKSVEAVRAELTELRAAADQAGEVSSRHRPPAGPEAAAADAKAWDKAIAKANARVPAAA